jgi:antitoxin component YwqK of YwqJK toxin-antitoxin module
MSIDKAINYFRRTALGLGLIAILASCSSNTVTCPKDAQKFPKVYPNSLSLYCIQNKVEHGPFMTWYLNIGGNRVEKSRFINTKTDEDYPSSWPTDGPIAERGQYDNGQREGKWVAFHRNGVKGLEMNFNQDKPEGDYTKWDENGHLVEQGKCKKGYKVGEWTTKDKYGEVTTETYNDKKVYCEW